MQLELVTFRDPQPELLENQYLVERKSTRLVVCISLRNRDISGIGMLLETAESGAPQNFHFQVYSNMPLFKNPNQRKPAAVFLTLGLNARITVRIFTFRPMFVMKATARKSHVTYH